MAKREVFTWKTDHDKLLSREMLVEIPHKFKSGSKERGMQWETIANNLNTVGLKVTKRSVRERFDKLYDEFQHRENVEKAASGVSVEYDELHKAMTEIDELIKDYEEQRTKKETKQKAQAEEMRKRATEKLYETKKRAAAKSSENISDDDDDMISNTSKSTKRRRSSQSSITDLLEKGILRKKEEHEEQVAIRGKEMDLKAEEIRQQQQFQAMVLQQMQQQQQQQQQQ